MFISISKTIARFGGFRIGIGKRITKKNWWYFGVFLFFYGMVMLCWYAILAALWLIYAMCYGIWWCIKRIIQAISKGIDKSIDKEERITAGKRYCSSCGAEIRDGDSFCGKCGTPGVSE